MTISEFERLLVGETVDMVAGLVAGSERVTFTCASGKVLAMAHEQGCCETVRLAEVVGEVGPILGTPILAAWEESNASGEPKPEFAESWTWTFYTIRTVRGTVVLRWLGESNGFYSERVWFGERP